MLAGVRGGRRALEKKTVRISKPVGTAEENYRSSMLVWGSIIESSVPAGK